MTSWLGALPAADGTFRFRVWAPDAERIGVQVRSAAAADARDEGAVVLRPLARGYHVGEAAARPGDRYRYVLGGAELPDPASRWQPDGVHGPSACVDPGAFTWTDRGWHGIALRDLVLYELHVGTFTPAGTFDAAAAELIRLASLGVTAVELMPVAQFPGTRNWGYDGVDPWAVQESYGGPDGLRRFVDASHAEGLAVVLDVVYNHLGPEGNYLRAFGPYFSDRYRTPWGDGVNVDGPWSDEVRAYFMGNARMWFEEYHVDGLRLDAIHGIIDTSAVPFLRELADATRDLADELGRTLVLIAESDLNDVRVIARPDDHGFGLDAQWADDLHHELHAMVTDERSGYYADFGDLDGLATVFERGWKFAGEYAASRRRRHGNDPRGTPGERFVVFGQNHDQVGNRRRGERLAELVDLETTKLVAAAVLLSPFIPLLFMGEEYRETAPFRYFVSHGDPELVEAVRRGRVEEFAGFAWKGDAPDPQATETFNASKLDASGREREPGRSTHALYAELLRLRREVPALARLDPGAVRTHVDRAANALVVHRRHPDGDAVLVLGFARTPADIFSMPQGPWCRALDTSHARWGGSGTDGGDRIEIPPEGGRIAVAARSAALYLEEHAGPVT
jgi:maltooligosyltrehalose trehalohydrolase